MRSFDGITQVNSNHVCIPSGHHVGEPSGTDASIENQLAPEIFRFKASFFAEYVFRRAILAKRVKLCGFVCVPLKAERAHVCVTLDETRNASYDRKLPVFFRAKKSVVRAGQCRLAGRTS